MGTLSLPLSMGVAPPEIFSEMPSGMKSYLSRGFADLAVLPFEKVQKLSSLIAGGFEPADEMTEAECAKILEVPREEVSKIIGALSLLIAFTTRRTDIDSVLQHAAKAGVVPAAHLPALMKLAEHLSERKGDYKEALEISSLAREVAPSFEDLDLAVELRFAFEGDVPTRSVPVVLCNLKTDSERSRVFFQLRKQDAQRIVEQLNKALKQIEALEKWSER